MSHFASQGLNRVVSFIVVVCNEAFQLIAQGKAQSTNTLTEGLSLPKDFTTWAPVLSAFS